MEFSLKFEKRNQAERLIEALKERSIAAKIEEKDNQIEVKYFVAECYNEEKAKSDYKKDDAVTQEVLENMFSRFSRHIFQEMNWQIKWIQSEIRYLENAFYEHEKGHLPPINSAGKMEQALTVLGVSDDYQVSKPIVRSFATRGATNIDLF